MSRPKTLRRYSSIPESHRIPTSRSDLFVSPPDICRLSAWELLQSLLSARDKLKSIDENLDEQLTKLDSLDEAHCKERYHEYGTNEYNQLRNMLIIFRLMSWGQLQPDSLQNPSQDKPPLQLIPEKRFEYAKNLVGSQWIAGSYEGLLDSWRNLDNLHKENDRKQFFKDAGMPDADQKVFQRWLGGIAQFMEEIVNPARQVTGL